MTIQANPEAIPFGITAMIAGALAVLAWRRVGRGGGALAASFAVMMAGEAAWSLFDALELLAGDLAVKQVVFALRVAGKSATVLGMVAVVLVYAGHARWLARHLAELAAPMVVLTLLAWANPLHHTYWSSIENRRMGGYLVGVTRHGPAFWAYTAYSYGLAAIATAVLVRAVWRSRGVFRAQAGFMLFGVVLPWVVNLVDLKWAVGTPHLDAGALAFGVAGLAFLPAMFRFGLLELTPVAWEAVVRRMEDAVFVIDSRRRIVGVNPAGERLLDRQAGAILGTGAARALARWPVLAARLEEIGHRTEGGFELIGPGSESDESATAVYDARISRLDGGMYQAGADAGAGASAGDEASGWVLVLRDVSASRRAEDERVRVLREQAARAEAETANRSKDRFLATLSHELRTPLSPILTTVTAILERPDTPEPLRAAMEMIRRNVHLEVRLIDDLLDLARVRGGKLHLKRETVDAHELIHRVAEICRDDLKRAGLRLAVDLAAARHDVDADPIRLQQVLWNLLKNAIKFTPAGGIITIRTHDGPAPARPPASLPADRGGVLDERGASAGGILVISVADTGIGIDAEVLPRIFDLFEQGSPESARRSGGLGLGLAISRSIIERHGGRLRAASAGADRGSTFTVEIPTVPAAAEVPTIEPSEPDAEAEADPALAGRRPLRILLVDDNDDTRNSLAELLTRRGHQVRGAAGVGAALRAANSAEIDLLISDIELADGTGLQLVQALRATRRVPAIAVSGMGSSDDLELSRAAGFDLHLMKPIHMPELEEAIARVGGRPHDALASRTAFP